MSDDAARSTEVDAHSSWKWKLVPVGLTLFFLFSAALFYSDGAIDWAISGILGAVAVVAIVLRSRVGRGATDS